MKLRDFLIDYTFFNKSRKWNEIVIKDITIRFLYLLKLYATLSLSEYTIWRENVFERE